MDRFLWNRLERRQRRVVALVWDPSCFEAKPKSPDWKTSKRGFFKALIPQGTYSKSSRN
jgi:hypothetical protein